MEIIINDVGYIELQKVFNPIVLRSDSGEVLTIQMRDSGFEMSYGTKEAKGIATVEAKNGVVRKISGEISWEKL